MGAYVCPSCGEPLKYDEDDLKTNSDWKGVRGQCPNEKTCGVLQVYVIISKSTEDSDGQ